MRVNTVLKYVSFLLLLFFVACKTDQKQPTPEVTVPKTKKSIPVPKFNAENAYAHIEKQVSFGPRSPNSDGHAACKEYIIKELEALGIKISTQDFKATGWEGTPYNGTNIIGSFNPDNKERIILAAHWDTRFTADEDDDNNSASVQADDGGSGVGALLEMGRLLKENPIELGVDLIFYDMEDQGQRNGPEGSFVTWGLGAQYWSKNPHVAGYTAKYGILLDMVGAKGAQFPKENVNGIFKPNVTRRVHSLYSKVWKLAASMGRAEYFVDRTVNGGIDDHFFVNKIAEIPMIDIINKPNEENSMFGDHWHTHDDNMDVIDVATLKNVGQVVTAVVYKEEMGKF
ncbi:MAG: M28 family peptidase [Bacteroidota bacterium]